MPTSCFCGPSAMYMCHIPVRLKFECIQMPISSPPAGVRASSMATRSPLHVVFRGASNLPLGCGAFRDTGVRTLISGPSSAFKMEIKIKNNEHHCEHGPHSLLQGCPSVRPLWACAPCPWEMAQFGMAEFKHQFRAYCPHGTLELKIPNQRGPGTNFKQGELEGAELRCAGMCRVGTLGHAA